MRKIRKKEKKKIGLKFMVIIFVVSLMTISIGYSYLSQFLSVEATGTIVSQEIMQDEFKTDNLLFTYEEKNKWYSSGVYNYQYDCVLENIGTQDYENWEIVIHFPKDMQFLSGWSANYSQNLGELIVSSDGTSLNSGQSVSFGFQFSTKNGNFNISKVTMDGNLINIGGNNNNPGTGSNSGGSSDDGDGGTISVELTPSYKITNTWSDGVNNFYQIEVTLANNTKLNTSSWSINAHLPSGSTITQNWNCNYINKDDYVTLSNVDYNANIMTNSNVSFGIVVSSPSKEMNITFD